MRLTADDAGSATRVTTTTETFHSQWVVRQRGVDVEQRTQNPVVLRRREAQPLSNRLFLRADLVTPRALEVKNATVAFCQLRWVHRESSLAAPPTKVKHFGFHTRFGTPRKGPAGDCAPSIPVTPSRYVARVATTTPSLDLIHNRLLVLLGTVRLHRGSAREPCRLPRSNSRRAGRLLRPLSPSTMP